MAAAVRTDIERVVDVVGTSSRCWILAATASTLHTSLAPRSRTMETTNVVGNTVDAVRTSGMRVMLGMTCIFNNYRLRIKIINIMKI
jgi:hypothetical protein